MYRAARHVEDLARARVVEAERVDENQAGAILGSQRPQRSPHVQPRSSHTLKRTLGCGLIKQLRWLPALAPDPAQLVKAAPVNDPVQPASDRSGAQLEARNRRRAQV